jgi:hypothetical protein
MINDILIEIARKGSIYDEIIDNIITPRFDLKPELISEIAISFLENRVKVEEAYEKNYFKYYFINTVRNQIHSNTSSFHKNIRIQDNEYFESYGYLEDETTIDDKIEFEERLDIVNDMYKNTKKSWFEATLWDEYFIKNKTYREIGNEYGINHCLIFHNVKKIKEKIKQKVKSGV